MLYEKAYCNLNSEELIDLQALKALNNLERIVKYVMSSEIPDDEVDYWREKLQSRHDGLLRLLLQQEEGFKESFCVADLENDKDILLARLAKRKLKINALEPNTDGNSSETSTIDADPKTSTVNKLGICPEISSKLPVFYGGDLEDWLKFSNSFMELVHNNTQIPISTKLHYLREKIQNKPRSLIAYLINGPDSDYNSAWEALEKRYGNRRILFTSELDCLLDLEMMKSDNYLSVQNMHDTAKKCIYLMKKHRGIGDSADEIFAHLLIRKMDARGRSLYEQHVRKTKSIQKLQDVMEFLEQQAEILENLEEISKQDSKILGPC